MHNKNSCLMCLFLLDRQSGDEEAITLDNSWVFLPPTGGLAFSIVGLTHRILKFLVLFVSVSLCQCSLYFFAIYVSTTLEHIIFLIFLCIMRLVVLCVVIKGSTIRWCEAITLDDSWVFLFPTGGWGLKFLLLSLYRSLCQCSLCFCNLLPSSNVSLLFNENNRVDKLCLFRYII